MSTARKYNANARSMSPESRRAAYGKINIVWLQMRPDLKFEDKDTIRDERLAWITSLLSLARPLGSTTELTDGQIGLVLDEMQKMTGVNTNPTAFRREKAQVEREHENVVNIADYRRLHEPEATNAEITHLSGEAQVFTINKLVGAIGWSEEHFREFLFRKFRRRSPRMLTFKDCNSLTMILLTIAADKELRAQGHAKISRAMTAKYIPVLKKKLQIDR